ncbi:MAG: tRNA preQ1(34) S-adenosylmethionine ribosyltransferase-isomerase QueA [Candidatus Woesearchaeota archaeon]
MKITDFDYRLPKELIAQNPSNKREKSRLLVMNKGKIEHMKFFNLIDYLRKGDVLVLNEAKVSKARLNGKKESGSKVELIIEKRIEKIYSCRINGRNIRKGNILSFSNGLKGKVVEREGALSSVIFNKKIKGLNLPLPPYIKKKPKDYGRYQTVFSKKEGSLAAPTAGLHFSKQSLERIRKKGVKIVKICLHIGFGTFLPVIAIKNHKTEEEYFEISNESADIINNRKGRLICVGTTVVKTLESASDKKGKIVKLKGLSDIFIKPGYKFRMKIDAMITNFHFPKSSLIMLVSAYFGRKKVLDLYNKAVKKKYRFFSFGDAMMIIKKD